MKIAELFVRLTADTSGLNKGLTGAQKQLDRFGKNAGRVAGLVGAGLFTGMVKSTIDAQNEMAQLNAVLKSTGGSAGVTMEQLDKMARQLQRVTTFSDGAVKGAQALLLTFTRIKGAEFEGATKAVLNVAQAMGTDLKSAAIQVGKALNDPILGLTSLSRSGIQFTADQKAVIKQMVAVGDTAGAQRVILKELETQFGGSAEAARNTLGGALKALANSFDEALEVSERSSKGIVGAINSIAEALPSVRDKIDSGLEIIKDQFRRFKRDILALKLGEAWADAQLRFWDKDAATAVEDARRRFWQAQNAIDPLTLPPVFVFAPEGSGKGGSGGGGGGDPEALAAAAAKAWQKLTGPMNDLLALQGAMKEAGMNTLSVDNQIFAAYQRINDEIARGVRLTTEQLAAAIRLKTELGAAMAPMPGGVGLTPMAGGNPMGGIKVKGSNLFDTKDQYGNPIQGQFNVPGAAPKDRSFGSKIKGFFSGPDNGDSMGTRVGQVLQAGGGGGQMGQMVQAVASFGPMAVLLPVINGAMEKLGPAFEKLIAPLVEFGAAIGEMLVPVFEMLAPVVRLVVASMKVFQPVLKMVVKGFSYLMQGLGMVVKAIGKMIDSLPFVKAPGIIRAGQEMIDAAKAARRNADATEKATDAVEKFADSLSNIPRVLNVNALRHMITGGPVANGGKPWAPPDKPLFTGPVTININGAGDPRRVAEEVGRVIERTGSRGGMTRLQAALA